MKTSEPKWKIKQKKNESYNWMFVAMVGKIFPKTV